MNDAEFSALEELTSRKLKELPMVCAPASLAENVLKIIVARSQPIGFWAWSLPLRVGVAFLSLVFGIGAGLGIHWLQKFAIASLNSTEVPAAISLTLTLFNGLLLSFKPLATALFTFASTPWGWATAAAIFALYLLGIGATAALLQLQKQIQRTL